MFQVTVLGTSSAVPAFGRYPTSQVLVHNERLLLVDCGEGTQFQLQRYRLRLRNLDAVFITHLHGDHVFGLPGLLTSMSIFQREAPLTLVGPAGIRSYLESIFSSSYTTLNYPLQYVEVPFRYDAPLPVYEHAGLQVQAFPLDHRIPCNGFRFQQQPKLPRFLAEQARRDDIPRDYFHLIKRGNNVTLPDGRYVQAGDYLGDADPAYSYAFCSDTRYNERILPFIDQCSVLYHEATFLHDRKARADETGHSTALEAARIAAAARTGELLIGHFSARYTDLQPLLDEARQLFPATRLAVEGETYPIGQPQRTGIHG